MKDKYIELREVWPDEGIVKVRVKAGDGCTYYLTFQDEDGCLVKAKVVVEGKSQADVWVPEQEYQAARRMAREALNNYR